MSRSWLCAVAAVLALSSCGKGDNPLVTASDGQFKQWIEPKNAFSASCAAGKISSVSEQQKTGCVSELQQRASQIGIAGNVTREQLLDDRVRQRYAAARKG